MTALIDQITVSSDFPYIVYGPVCGLIGEHRSLQRAGQTMRNDAKVCRMLGNGAYSDAAVYAWSDSHGWVIMDSFAPER